MHYAHSGNKEDMSDWQPLCDHLNSVARLAKELARQFDQMGLARISGLFHDIGKYSGVFQERLKGAKDPVDHITAGAKLADELIENSLVKMVVIYAILGHHGGIPDYDNGGYDCVVARLEKVIDDFSDYKTEMSITFEESMMVEELRTLDIDPDIQGYQLANLVRMVFSVLVDADYIDTESACNVYRSSFRNSSAMPIDDLLATYNDHITEIEAAAKTSTLNSLRASVLRECVSKSALKPNVFKLPAPTGIGKTLTSLGFALNHAKANGMRRIIYVIPYINIIEQTARVFKNIYKEEMVLEHHCGFQFDDEGDGSRLTIKLASENWDAPIIVTTNVQFFESLFSNRPSKCRKLHNISNSVVIFDEAQMFPYEYLKPTLATLSDLVLNYKCSVIMCTATQPDFDKFFSKKLKPVNLLENYDVLYNQLKRVDSKFIGRLNDVDVVEHMSRAKQALTIVNTRKHARKLFKLLGQKEGHFHLSARMTPEHRKTSVEKIRYRLSKGMICRVVSTQLIEAGVDIDFPLVYRSIAGLDSIIQAAGRCNREGKPEMGQLVIFEPEAHGMPKGWLSRMASYSRQVLRMYEDPICVEAVEAFFKLALRDEDYLDNKKMTRLNKMNKKCSIPFRQIASEYRLIDHNMISVIIPFDKSDLNSASNDLEGLLEQLVEQRPSRAFLRKLQPYTVQVYKFEYDLMCSEGLITAFGDDAGVLSDSTAYSNDVGLMVPRED